MHFLIWLPDDERTRSLNHKARLEHVGLADIAQGSAYLSMDEGPSGGLGRMISWPSPGKQHWPYDERSQTWIPSSGEDEDRGRYWVGWYTDDPPQPHDLIRHQWFDGPSCFLGDGNSWILPAPERLPWDVLLADDGTYKYEPQRRFMAYIAHCREWQARMEDPVQRADVLVHQLVPLLEQSLGINYRMPRELASALRLWSTGPKGTLEAALNLIVRVEP